MAKTWEIISRELRNRLERKGIAVTGHKIKVSDVAQNMKRELAYTADDRIIRINASHPILNGLSNEHKSLVYTGLWTHEIGHQLYTDFSSMRAFESKPSYEQQLCCQILNICEDAAIENFIRRDFEESFVTSIRFLNALLYKEAELPENASPFMEVMQALNMFGIFGVVKNTSKMSQKAKEVFWEAIKPFDKLIEEPDTQKRFEYVCEIIDMLKPLWESEKKAAEELEEMMRQLMRNINTSSNRNLMPNDMMNPQSNGNDALKQRRRVTFQRITKEEMEELKQNQQQGTDDGTSDITILYCDEQLENEAQEQTGNGGSVSMPVPQNEKSESSDSGDGSGGSSDSDENNTEMSAENNEGGNSANNFDDKNSEQEAESGSSGSSSEKSSEKSSSGGACSENNDTQNDGGETTEGNQLAGQSKPDSSGSGKDTETEAGENGSEDKASQPSNGNESSDATSINSNSSKPMTIGIGEGGESDAGTHSGNPNSFGRGKKLDMQSVRAETQEESELVDNFDINDEITISQDDIEQLKETNAQIISEYNQARKRDEDNSEPLDLDIKSQAFVTSAICHNHRVRPAETLSGYDAYLDACRDNIRSFTNALKKLEMEAAEEKNRRTSGKLNPYRLNNGHFTPRVFDKRNMPSKNDIAICLCIDESGSMSGSVEEVRKAAITIAETCQKLKIPIYIMGFTTGRSRDEVEHYHYIKWKNNATTRTTLMSLSARRCNCDGYSIRYATKILEKRPESQKLLLVVTDGCPSSSLYKSTLEGVEDTKAAVAKANKTCICHGIAIGDYDTDVLMSEFGRTRFCSVSTAAEVFKELSKILKKRFKESLNKR